MFEKVTKEITNDIEWNCVMGRQFMDAYYILIGEFIATKGEWKTGVLSPSYYCAALAIEHFLRGYLKLRQIPVPHNSKSHDLTNLINKDKKQLATFFELDRVDIEQIDRLNKEYYMSDGSNIKDHRLRYLNKAVKQIFPHPDSLYKIVKKMHDKLQKTNTELYIRETGYKNL